MPESRPGNSLSHNHARLNPALFLSDFLKPLSQTLIGQGFPGPFGEFPQRIAQGVFVQAVDESQDVPGSPLEVLLPDTACAMNDPLPEVNGPEDARPQFFRREGKGILP